MTVAQLSELLRHQPADAQLYAYDGAAPGLVIAEPDGFRIDFIFLPRENTEDRSSRRAAQAGGG